MTVMAEHRVSNVVYVLVRLDIDNRDYLLFYTHPKWSDFGLVGGHVEADEESRWAVAATREAAEELAPLVPGRDFELVPLPQGPERWGPEQWGPPQRVASTTEDR
jgi:hypothetical protein